MHPFHLVMIYFQFFFQVSFEGDLAPMIIGSDLPGSVTVYRKGEEVRKRGDDYDEGRSRGLQKKTKGKDNRE
jgi:hypothetical protein